MKLFKRPAFRALVGAAVLTGMFLPAATVLAGDDQTITGEVVDLMCYLDHGAKGDKHASCASKCISSGGPVGLLTADDQLYLVIGQHKPMNDKLAEYAAKKVTLKGKVVEKNGMKMIQNAEIQTQSQ
jgi:hypothetical protein